MVVLEVLQHDLTNLFPFPFSLSWIYVHVQGEEHHVLEAMVWVP